MVGFLVDHLRQVVVFGILRQRCFRRHNFLRQGFLRQGFLRQGFLGLVAFGERVGLLGGLFRCEAFRFAVNLRRKHCLLGVAVGLVAHIAEIVVERASALQQRREVGGRDYHRTHLRRQGECGRGGHHLTVMVDLLHIIESFDNQQAEPSEIHLFEVEILHHER